MSLEVFVRASGAVMGLARDSFCLGVGGGPGSASTSGSSPTLAAAFSGSGQAASAAASESTAAGGQLSALGEQNLAADAHLDGALAAAGAGRGQMEAVIDAALADINSLAAATSTLVGQQALVNALTVRLEQTWQALTNGHGDASTRAASSTQLAAAYRGLGGYPIGALATSPMSYPGMVSPAGYSGAMSSMGAMSSTMPMMAAASMAANQAALSGAQAAGVQGPMSNGGPRATLTSDIRSDGTAARVNTVVSRAMAERGVPYVWGGGGLHGPTKGGFDCSGLVQYAYAGVGVDLPRTSELQYRVGTAVAPSQVRAGDLIFMNWGEGGVPGPGHVMLAISNTHAVQAPQPGEHVDVTPIPTSGIAVKRILH